MEDVGKQGTYNSTEHRASYRSRNTNYIGGGATVTSAIQIAGNYHGGLDLRDLPGTATDQTAHSEARRTDQDDETRQQAVDLLWHLARVDPDKRIEAIAIIEALEATAASAQDEG
ncbi:hypothetical protein [Streptomyces sulphureus]|uniref:hypothetical protein n=1 Tax=Streptomyces sulphureus TaxID=47758 RepID=UPI0003703C84|nr:hypothetical protein [Streptomyces sulphureus]